MRRVALDGGTAARRDPDREPRPDFDRESRPDLDRELRRVLDRLASLSLDRLARPAPPWPSRAAAARAAAAVLADAARGIEARYEPQPPQPLAVPVLADHAAAAQVAVTGTDLQRALAAVPGGAPVWWAGKRTPVDEVVARCLEALVSLHRAL